MSNKYQVYNKKYQLFGLYDNKGIIWIAVVFKNEVKQRLKLKIKKEIIYCCLLFDTLQYFIWLVIISIKCKKIHVLKT